MSLLKRMFGNGTTQKPRVRICVECGMPVAEQRDWCSILRCQQEMERAAAARAAGPATPAKTS